MWLYIVINQCIKIIILKTNLKILQFFFSNLMHSKKEFVIYTDTYWEIGSRSRLNISFSERLKEAILNGIHTTVSPCFYRCDVRVMFNFNY
ncbi:hypothetical protein BpHYR1_051052 [Brachionus plicatilis]|uniref:Uncharacterized protein n=1 Tax=Brachionus plicatilis TaxID=10195 RepID=A0A3M7PQZ0_BRAPC|nr:hypothetical protein BpHYR1_051052 [Brachionus plicatilis]